MLIGKVAIVTGCSCDTGRAITETLTRNSAVIYAVDLMRGGMDDIVSGRIIPYCFDICDTKAIAALVQRVKEEQGKIGILVDNAGTTSDLLIPMVTDSQIQKTFEANVFVMMHFIQYVSEITKHQHSGSIVNAVPIIGIGDNYTQVMYAASKGAVIVLTEPAAEELAKDGIRVNAVAPGTINTLLLQKTPEGILDKIKSRICWGQSDTPEEVANAYMFLASDLSSYISGQILDVDGMMIN